MWTLKKKIVLLTLFITATVSVIIGVVMYQYSLGVVTQNLMHDSALNTEKLTADMDDAFETARNYARQAIVDEAVRELLTEGDDGSVNEATTKKRAAYDSMSKMLALSGTVDAFALVKAGECLVWTDLAFWDENSRAISQQWYEAYLSAAGMPSQGDDAVSKPFAFSVVQYLPEGTEMLCIQMPVYSLNGKMECCGSLVVVMYLDNILQILEKDADYFDCIDYSFGDDMHYIIGDAAAMQQLTDVPQTANGAFIVNTSNTEFGGTLTTVVNRASLFNLTFANIGNLALGLIGAIALIMILMLPMILHLTSPVNTLAKAMQKIGAGDMETRVSIHTKDEFETLGTELNAMVQQLDQNIKLTYQANMDKQYLEYEVLMAQINPHFIYNTLNTIIYLARKNRTKDVEQITRALIDLLQDGIKLSGNKNFSTMKVEIYIIKSYVCIQNYRYQDEFDVKINCPDALLSCKIPSSVIQPLVENALFHGIVPLQRRGTIIISVSKENRDDRELTHIQISDDGVGLSEEQIAAITSGKLQATDVSRNHVGIQNIIRRLSLLYGERYKLEIHSQQGKGTSIDVFFPYEQSNQ